MVRMLLLWPRKPIVIPVRQKSGQKTRAYGRNHPVASVNFSNQVVQLLATDELTLSSWIVQNVLLLLASAVAQPLPGA